MKMTFLMVMIVTVISGCGTIGGAMQGAGEDLNRAGGYMRGMGK